MAGRRTMRGGGLSRLTAMLLALLAAACAAPGREAGTAVMASGADLESANPLVTIHPLARQVQRHVLLVTLARYDDDLTPEPYFARGWIWSADRRTLTFPLHDGLRWQDGAPTTSADVRFTLDVARDPATGYARQADLADLLSVDTPDDTTVVLSFANPQAGFPMVLCELPLVPRHLLAGVPRDRMRQHAFATSPVGNGPFRFVERRAGQRWVFERNSDFPLAMGGPPALARLVIAVVDESTTKIAGLVGGELDLAGINPATAQLVERDPLLRVVDYPVLFSNGLVMNVHRAPLDDVRVRRAIALSLDRARIGEAAVAGYATPAWGPVPPDHPWAADVRGVTDIALADSLLEAAGWSRGRTGLRERSGVPLTLEMLTAGSADGAVEQLLQADLGNRGIRVEIRHRELGSFLAEARAPVKRFDLLFTGIPGDLSLAYLTAMFDSRLAGGALDYAGYHTPRLDGLLAMARAAGPGEGARDAWLAVQAELDQTMPIAWIYHSRGVQGVARRLRNLTLDLRGELTSVALWEVDGDPPRAATLP